MVKGTKEEILRRIGKSMREWRLRADITQQDLADRSGVSLRMIRAYEQGTQDLARAEGATLLRLSQALGCPPDRLITSNP